MIPTPAETNTWVESATGGPSSEVPSPDEALPSISIDEIDLALSVEVRTLPRFDRPLEVTVRQATLLNSPPWIRPLGKLGMDVTTQGWRFPTPPDQIASATKPRLAQLEPEPTPPAEQGSEPPSKPGRTRLRPPRETVLFKDRLLYLLQPPLEDLFAGKQVSLPFKPYPYQLSGIAFLMPRHAALHRRRDGAGQDGAGHRRAAAALPRRPDPPRPGRLPQAAGHQLDARAAHLGRRTCPSRSSAATPRRGGPPGTSPTARSSWSTTSC